MNMKSRIALLATLTLACACSQKPEETAQAPAAVKQAESVPSPAAPVSREAIAALKEPIREVKLRQAQDLVWTDGADGSALAHKDAVKTGTGASGTIEFTDRSVLTLGESTMVIVVDKARKQEVEQTVIALPAGTVDGKLDTRGGKPVELVIRTARGWIKANNQGGKAAAGFQATVSQTGALKVSSSGGGEVKLETAAGEVRIEPNKTVALPAAPDAKPVSLEQLEKATVEEFAQPPSVPVEEVKKAVAEAKPYVPEPEKLKAEVKESEKPAAPAKKVIRVADVFKLLEPKNKAQVSSPETSIQGIVSGQLKAYLNGVEVPAAADGKFAVKVPLELGANVFTFQVIGPGPNDVKYETLEIIRK